MAYAAACMLARMTSPRRGEKGVVHEHMARCRDALPITPDAGWRAYMDHATANSLNTYMYRQMDRGWLGDFIQVRGEEHLRPAFAKGKGVLVLSAHQHSLMLLGVTIGLLNYPIHAILMDPAVSVPDFLKDYAQRAIEDSSAHYNGGGYIFVDYQKTFVRPVFRALQGGRVVVSANDFPRSLAPKRRLTMPFLGQRISCPTGSVEIALQCGAPIVPAFIRRMPDGGFLVEFHPEIESLDVTEIMKRYAGYLAATVAADPGGWEGWKWADLFDLGKEAS